MEGYGAVLVVLCCGLGTTFVQAADVFNATGSVNSNVSEAIFNATNNDGTLILNATDGATPIFNVTEGEQLYNISTGSVDEEVSHNTTLMWTEKETRHGEVRIAGIPGDVKNWIATGKATSHGQSTPLDYLTRITSHRIALGFDYAKQSIFWSDRGFKEILKVRLQVRSEAEYVYNVTVKRIFTGTSTEVNGVAVDWIAGNIYWTDALYNSITVARADQYEVFRELIDTRLDKPQGIAVHPARGYMFWSDWGAVPKIERANLDGTDRRILMTSDLDHPQGMTVDYDLDHVYWVDDFRDTIERADLDGRDRASFKVSPRPSILGQNTLFGIAVYKDYLFVSDQLDNTIKVFNKTTQGFLAAVVLHAVPYDVMMYDESLQQRATSPCASKACEHLCVSLGLGRAKCVCKERYKLNPDMRTCNETDSLHQPIYIYSVGHSICGARINIPDRPALEPHVDVDCFLRDLKRVVALAFDAAGELLYYSDDLERTIIRTKLVHGNRALTIMAQTGKVRGMVVDYLNANLYWADEYYDHIMVSRLEGRYPRILLKNVGRPRGLAIFPATRKLYWSDTYGNIWEANLDGSGVRSMLENLRSPDGMVIDPSERRLYYAEGHGIKSMAVDGTDTRTLHFADGDLYRDVTVYNDYYAWTDNRGQINFGLKGGGKPVRGLVHENSRVSHDVIAYGPYLQPKSISPCDAENGGCDQLCLPSNNVGQSNRTCSCMFGYQLARDGHTCESHLLDGHFIMGIDPYHKALYQLDLRGGAPFQARALRDAEFPAKFDYDPQDKMVYWVDKLAYVIKRSPLLERGEYVVKALSPSADVDAMALSVTYRHLYYSDTASKTISRINLDGSGEETFVRSWATAMAVDDAGEMVYWSEVRSSSIIYSQPMGTADRVQVWTSEVQVTGLTIDHLRQDLYWCTATNIFKMNMKTRDIEHVASDTYAHYINIAVAEGEVYVTHQDQKSIYRVFNKGENTVNMTELVFARITDLKEYKRIVNTVPRLASSVQNEVNNLVVYATVAVAAVLIFIILLVAVLLWYRRRNKKVPKSDYKAEAHDNPEYMETQMAPPLPMPGTTPMTVISADVHNNEESNYSYIAGARTSISSRDSDLPDVVMSKEGLPLPSDLGKLQDLESQAGDGVDPNFDTEQLVKPSEVKLDVDNLKDGMVSYKAQ